MEGRLGLSKSHRRSAVFNSRATTTPGTTVSSSKNELLELVAPWVEDLYDSDKISGDTEEKEFGQFIFTTLRETVFSDPSNSDSLEWLGEELEEDDKCEMAELWRENFTFDNSSEVRVNLVFFCFVGKYKVAAVWKTSVLLATWLQSDSI